MNADAERMVTVKERIYEVGADGIKRLRFAPGQSAPADEVKRLTGKTPPASADVKHEVPPAKPLERMKLDELKALCEAEGIDPGEATLRADFIAAIEAARAAAAAHKGEADTAGDAGDGDSGDGDDSGDGEGDAGAED